MLPVNGVGEPCAGEPHARFEAAGAGNGADVLRHRASPRPYIVSWGCSLSFWSNSFTRPQHPGAASSASRIILLICSMTGTGSAGCEGRDHRRVMVPQKPHHGPCGSPGCRTTA
jgi:hypothetical protein